LRRAGGGAHRAGGGGRGAAAVARRRGGDVAASSRCLKGGGSSDWGGGVSRAQIARLQTACHREGVDAEYLKNVVVKYIVTEADAGPAEHQGLVGVLAQLLKFSQEDLFVNGGGCLTM
jgi:hypothetical protein